MVGDEIMSSTRIRQLRTGSNLSQEELANKLGVSQNTVSKWERDDREPDL